MCWTCDLNETVDAGNVLVENLPDDDDDDHNNNNNNNNNNNPICKVPEGRPTSMALVAAIYGTGIVTLLIFVMGLLEAS